MQPKLREFFPDLIEAVKKELPPETQGLEAGAYGKYYKPGTDIYVGRVENGKWIPATQEKQKADKKTNSAPVKQQKGQTPQSSTPKKGTPTQVGQKKTSSEAPEIPQTSFVGSNYVLDGIKGKSNKVRAYGAGTKESVAAEAATVYAANVLLDKYRTSDLPVNEFLKKNNGLLTKTVQQLINSPDSAIPQSWERNVYNQVIGIYSVIGNKFGKITEIAWDHDEGRRSMGLKSKASGDPSDIYVKVDGHGVVGVSLKKDGKSFIANGGWGSIVEKVSLYTDDEAVLSDIQGLMNIHSIRSRSEEKKLMNVFNRTPKWARKMKSLTRDEIEGADAKTFDQFFDEDGRFSDKFKSVIFSGEKLRMAEDGTKERTGPGVISRSNPVFNLFVKALEEVDETSTEGLRSVDRKATKELLKYMDTNPKVNETVRAYMVNELKINTMLKEHPFGRDKGIRNVITVYGEGTVDAKGNNQPMYIDREVLIDTFGPDIEANPSETFFIDSKGDSSMGYVRLRVKNPTPPPYHYYPTVASINLRSRTKGKGATLDVKQHEAYTFSIAARSPDPSKWTKTMRRNYAQSTLNYLEDLLSDDSISKEERANILQDVKFHSQMFKDNK